MKLISLGSVLAILALGGCATWNPKLPDTLGDPKQAQAYGYHPLDPLPVTLTGSSAANVTKVLKALPDETMRLAIGEKQANGTVTFGTAKTGYAGSRYVVILDYMKFTTKSFGVNLTKENNVTKATLTTGANPSVVVPVYLGVGLRLAADLQVNEGNVDLGNLIAIGAAGQAKQVTGTLTIQTLGLSGEKVTSIVPMPNDISSSSIQQAIQALGTIKAKIYDTDTWISPRVVGVYNNLGGGEETINGFISSLLEKPQTIDIP